MAFSTPLICCSSGVMTVSAMVFGDAPGYWPLTTTVGGTISGYSLIGSTGIANIPAAVMRIASTVAKIGRSMKNEEMFIARPTLRGAGRRRRGAGRIGAHGHRLRRHGEARMRTLGAVHHDDVSRLQALANDAQAVDHAAELDAAILHLVVCPQQENVLLVLVGVDGTIVDQNGRILAAAEQLHPCEHPRRVHAIFVVENRPRPDGSGLRIQLVIDEIDLARVREAFLVGETDAYGIFGIA